MKKFIAITLVGIMLFSLSACSANDDLSTQNSSSAHTESVDRPTTDNEAVIVSEANNILITYFAVAENSEVDAIASASVREVDGDAKGHIRVLADVIESNVGGDMFSIRTSTKYPGGVRELIEYADVEQKQNVRPELITHIENLDDYDVIFIGYPNWWYDLPMVMYSFFEEYDFSGKIVVPFCTHNGSRFSNTINTIRELEPNATVLDGFTTSGDNVEKVSDDVSEWISKLDL